MNRQIAIAIVAFPVAIMSVLAKSASAIELPFVSEVSRASVVVAQQYNDYDGRRDRNSEAVRREEARREEGRREEARREEARREEGRRDAPRRVWIPGHWEPGFLGIGRKWVEGHWEDR